MSSTNFVGAVTAVPAEWANDVNRLVYDVLGAPLSLSGLQSILGISALQAGVGLNISGSNINGTIIGAVAASTGRFTSVKITGSGVASDDVVTHGQLNAELTTVYGLLGTVSQQNANAVAVTGGTVNGVIIGGVTPAAGTFTFLGCDDPTVLTGVVNLRTLNSRFATLPVFGTMAVQNANAIAVTGGVINGTVIGATAPSTGRFTSVTANSLIGSNVSIALDSDGYAMMLQGTSVDNKDVRLALLTGGNFSVDVDGTELNYNGRLCINTDDDGVSAIQTGGAIRAGSVSLGAAPTAPSHAVTMAWVQNQLNTLSASVPLSISTALGGLGSLASQDSDALDVTGGSINGVAIGGTVPALGRFTQVFGAQVSGTDGTLVLNGTGGVANSAAVLSANSDARPNISVIPNAGGAFVVMAGAQSVFKTGVSGRTVVGLGSDDGSNVLQVFGNTSINGKLTFNGGDTTGSSTLSLGTTAPVAVAANAPLWVRVRVNVAGVVKECVMPAWETL